MAEYSRNTEHHTMENMWLDSDFTYSSLTVDLTILSPDFNLFKFETLRVHLHIALHDRRDTRHHCMVHYGNVVIM